MNPTLKLYQQSRAQDRMNLARDPLIGGIIDRPGGGGGAVDWSVFAFGAEVVSGANNYISVTGGEVRHSTRATIEVAAAPAVKIVSDHYLVFVSYTIGSAAAIGSGAVCPVDTSTIIYWPLHKWRLIDGVASLEMIYHLGVIKIPGVFA